VQIFYLKEERSDGERSDLEKFTVEKERVLSEISDNKMSPKDQGQFLKGLDKRKKDIETKIELYDVKIVEQESFNLQVNTFFAVPQNAATPLDFVEPINFLADVENKGAATQFKVPLEVIILDNGFKEVFKTRNVYDTLPSNAVVENKLFSQTFTPAAKGVYLGYYEILSDKVDADSSNNTQEFLFTITDSTFSKDLGPNRTIRPADASWTAGEPRSWAFGNYYYVPKGNNKYIKSISFMIGNASQL